MDAILEIQWPSLLAAYLFVVVVLALVRAQGLGRESEIALATVRMTLQLMAVGYLLVYVFERPSPLTTVVIFLAMQVFAVCNVFGRVRTHLLPSLKRVIAVCVFSGTVVSLMYFLLVVVRISPWYDPRYLIPLAGMIVGNSMTGIAVGVERLSSGIRAHLDQIEAALMLGATPRDASRPFAREAFGAAIMPTINSMMGMGIVSLPGMMTGQILSGTSPVTAVHYQIAIMLGIAGSVSITVYLMTQLGYRTFFNRDCQVHEELH